MDGSGHAGDDAGDAVDFILIEYDVLGNCCLARLRRSVHEDGLRPAGGGTRGHKARKGGRGCRGGQRWRRGAHWETDTDNGKKVFSGLLVLLDDDLFRARRCRSRFLLILNHQDERFCNETKFYR